MVCKLCDGLLTRPAVEALEALKRVAMRDEQERIINLMNSHRVVFSLDSFEPVLNCNKCGNVTGDQPSHLMRLIKEGNK